MNQPVCLSRLTRQNPETGRFHHAALAENDSRPMAGGMNRLRPAIRLVRTTARRPGAAVAGGRLAAGLARLASLAGFSRLAGFAALLVALAPAGAQADGLCRKQAFEGVGYVVCEVPLRQHQVRMYLNGQDGQPYGRLSRLVDSPAGKDLVLAVNGGMYRDDRSPVGLFVEGGRQVRAASTRRGSGNFHMKPNGVFYITRAGGAGVMTTERYLRQKPDALYATQSGPMLVIDGKLHPRFAEEGQSLKIRNGVGVRKGQVAVFAISDQPVSFGAFARLFRDVLKTPDALYLDGTISSIYAPEVGRRDWLYPVGPIIGVASKPAPAAPAPPRRPKTASRQVSSGAASD